MNRRERRRRAFTERREHRKPDIAAQYVDAVLLMIDDKADPERAAQLGVEIERTLIKTISSEPSSTAEEHIIGVATAFAALSLGTALLCKDMPVPKGVSAAEGPLVYAVALLQLVLLNIAVPEEEDEEEEKPSPSN